MRAQICSKADQDDFLNLKKDTKRYISGKMFTKIRSVQYVKLLMVRGTYKRRVKMTSLEEVIIILATTTNGHFACISLSKSQTASSYQMIM